MFDQEIRAKVAAARREVAELAPERNRRAAALLGKVRPRLRSERQREIAKEIVGSFEKRAATRRRRPTRR